MDKKITRRLVLGSVIGGLAVGPFILRAFRKPPLPLGEDSDLVRFRKQYTERLSYPDKYERKLNKYVLAQMKEQSPEVIEEILDIHERQWANLAKVSGAKFDYYRMSYDVDGTPMPNNFTIDGLVNLKYGYGLSFDGKRLDTNEEVHWVFNLDGDVSDAQEEMDLSSLVQTFFSYSDVSSSLLCLYTGFYERDVELPENPFLQSTDRYDVLTGTISPGVPPAVREHSFYRYYVNRRTGMEEMQFCISPLRGYDEIYRSHPERVVEDLVSWYIIKRYTEISGVSMLNSYESYPFGSTQVSQLEKYKYHDVYLK